MKLRPMALCATRASPGPGSPTGTSSHCRTSGPPVLWKRIACAMSSTSCWDSPFYGGRSARGTVAEDMPRVGVVKHDALRRPHRADDRKRDARDEDPDQHEHRHEDEGREDEHGQQDAQRPEQGRDLEVE